MSEANGSPVRPGRVVKAPEGYLPADVIEQARKARRRFMASALALGAGSQMLQPLAISVIGGIVVSMFLSLVVTPAIQYYLEGRPRSG